VLGRSPATYIGAASTPEASVATAPANPPLVGRDIGPEIENHSISHPEAVMNRPIPLDATPALTRALGTVAERRFALWAFVAVLIVTACTVLILHASITPEQRIALFAQSGFFP
jgi:hypothetical protein